MPKFVRQFVYDSIIGGLVAIGTLNLVLPQNIESGQAMAYTIASAVGTAVLKAAARAFPDFSVWLAGKLNVGTE